MPKVALLTLSSEASLPNILATLGVKFFLTASLIAIFPKGLNFKEFLAALVVASAVASASEEAISSFVELIIFEIAPDDISSEASLTPSLIKILEVFFIACLVPAPASLLAQVRP